MNPALKNPNLRIAATAKELIAASTADPRQYPQDMPCLNCGYRWMQHMGLLCPIEPGHWSNFVDPATGYPFPIPPKFGNKLFVPDEDYYREPDFDVS